MNKQLIRDLAITGGIYDCITDPYDKLNNGDPYSSVMIDLERFAEKIIKECTNVVEGGRFLHDQAPTALFAKECSGAIKRHFGVKE
jgi:hypothetical protein